jgi:hypothetical protein
MNFKKIKENIQEILEILKLLPQNFLKIWLIFITLGLIFLFFMLFSSNNLINTYLLIKIMSFQKAQNISAKFNHEVQLIIDSKILKAQEKLKGMGQCLFEYILIESAGKSQNRYFGYVMYSRIFDVELKKAVEVREKYLQKTHRDIDYGISYSKYKDEDARSNPFGTAKFIADLLHRDNPNHTIMYDTFKRKDGKYTGNFIFEIEALGYSYIRDSADMIIAHPVILCDKEALDIFGLEYLANLTKELHTDLVRHANSSIFSTGNEGLVK